MNCCTATSVTGSSRPNRVASPTDSKSTSEPRSCGVGSRSVTARAVNVGSSIRQSDEPARDGSGAIRFSSSAFAQTHDICYAAVQQLCRQLSVCQFKLLKMNVLADNYRK